MLYRNNGNGTFTDVSTQPGIGRHASWGMGAVYADYDNDFQHSVLYRNHGQGLFEDVSSCCCWLDAAGDVILPTQAGSAGVLRMLIGSNEEEVAGRLGISAETVALIVDRFHVAKQFDDGVDLNRASEAVGRTIAELREITSSLKAVFLGFCS